MSAAAAETEELQGGETPEVEQAGPVRPAPPTMAYFVSKRENLVIVVEKDPFTRGPDGERVFDVGKHVGFVDGQLRVPLEGVATGTRGEKMDAAELIEFLEDHILFGNREEGFWRYYEAAPAVSQEESDQLIVFAEERDLEGIESFIEAEREGWNRPDLLRVAEGTRDRVKARLEE